LHPSKELATATLEKTGLQYLGNLPGNELGEGAFSDSWVGGQN